MLVRPILVTFTTGTQPATDSRHRRPKILALVAERAAVRRLRGGRRVVRHQRQIGGTVAGAGGLLPLRCRVPLCQLTSQSAFCGLREWNVARAFIQQAASGPTVVMLWYKICLNRTPRGERKHACQKDRLCLHGRGICRHNVESSLLFVRLSSARRHGADGSHVSARRRRRPRWRCCHSRADSMVELLVVRCRRRRSPWREVCVSRRQPPSRRTTRPATGTGLWVARAVP